MLDLLDKTTTVTRPSPSLRGKFIPVIFGNGEDDDTVGLIAAIEHNAVLMDDHTYEPPEDITIENRTLVMSESLYVVRSDDHVSIVPPGFKLVRKGRGPRTVLIRNCTFVSKDAVNEITSSSGLNESS
jgi:hypothetical protein